MDRLALITGSSSGIGLLTAVTLARRGYRVVATMRDLKRRSLLDQAARDAGVSDHFDVRALDISDFDSMPRMVSDILRDHGRIDVLVNNAGFAFAGFTEDIRLAELRQQMDTNFFGHVAVTQAVLPAMRAQRAGHIIMVSSESGRMGSPGIGSYSASKFALEGWSETLRLESRALGIKVVLVEPGAFKTDIWDRNARLNEALVTGRSPNQERGRKLKEWAVTTPKADPQQVADLIARIAEDPDPRLRYMIGRDALAHWWLRNLLPWKWYEKLVLRKVGLE
ncbi:MAG: SDR family oxidoreductase [Acidobacteriia bacterium]|nr:SDR family oxidoreductase [Terriglobia bacterium]